MERIRYMRIGDCDFGGEYTIEMSTATPPEPFCTTDGGDEWDSDCGADVTGRFIQLYIDYAKEKPFDYIDTDTGERFFQLPPYNVWEEFTKEYEGAKEEENDDAEDWESPVKKWKSFEKTILCETYREKKAVFFPDRHRRPGAAETALLLVFIKMWKRVRSMPGLQEEKRYGNDIRSGHAFKLWNSM